MNKLQKITACLALLAPVAFAHQAAAVGGDVNFCTEVTDANGNIVISDSSGTIIVGPCVDAKAHVKAAVVVTSVDIEQQATHKKVCANTTMKHTANLKSGNGFRLSLDPNCNYVFKFNTTSGCAGDKQGQLTHENMNNGENEMVLGGACGTLKAKSGKMSKSEERN